MKIYPITLLVISLALLVKALSPFFKKVDNSPEKILLMQQKREEVQKLYPSDISMRGYINSPSNLYDPNELVYIVIEGLYLYFISEKDMQVKFTVPTYNITRVKKYNSAKKIAHKLNMRVPNAVVDNFHLVFGVKYKNDDGKINDVYLFYDEAPSIYDKFNKNRDSVYIRLYKILSEQKK